MYKRQAIELLLEVIGVRYQLDRITIIRTDIKAKTTGRQYQWTSARAPEVLQKPGSFTKEDFLTLFHSYDEYGTTVLQYDNLEMYSEDAANLLMQEMCIRDSCWPTSGPAEKTGW